MELTIPFRVDRSVAIPERLDPSFVITEIPIGYNSRVICKRADCTYVAKFITVRGGEYSPECYTNKDVVRNEILISQMAARLEIGPGVHATALNDKQGILVMDKYDGDLDDLLYLYQSDRTIPIGKVMEIVGEALRILHQNGIVHRDIHPGNIFYSKDGKIAIGDYGASLLSDDPTLRAIDCHDYRGIQEVIKKIEEGIPYKRGDFFELSSIPPSELRPERIYLTWNGNICNDFV